MDPPLRPRRHYVGLPRHRIMEPATVVALLVLAVIAIAAAVAAAVPAAVVAVVGAPIAFGLVMAGIDAVALPTLKVIHDRAAAAGTAGATGAGTAATGASAAKAAVPMSLLVLGPLLLYAIQPLLFYKSLDYGTLAGMNIIWDVLSDIAVTAVGLWYFRERITRRQGVGIVLGVVAVGLIGGGRQPGL